MNRELLLFIFSFPLLDALPQEPVGVLYKKEDVPYKLEVFPAPEGVPYESQGSPQLVEINQAPWPSEELGSPFELFNQANIENTPSASSSGDIQEAHEAHIYGSENVPPTTSSDDMKEAHEDHPYGGDARSEGVKGREVSCQVLILGAGMAGITAMKTLQDLGITDIKMVEGSDRIGGRVKDVEFGGVNVEVGANWVHFQGIENGTENPIEGMVREAGLNFVYDDYTDFIYRYKGQNVTEESYKIAEEFEKVVEITNAVAARKRKNGEPDVNYRVAFALADWRPTTPLKSAVEFYKFDFEFGDEPADTGFMDNVEFYMHDYKPDMFVADKRGYSHVIKKMAEKLDLKENENIFFNDYVTQIRYDEPGEKKVRVQAKNSKDGSINVYWADYVITTFSIGVLESDLVEFVPRLPPWKMEIIYMYKMVRYIKIFIKFPEGTKAFWDDNHYIFYVDPTTRGHYQTWQNLEARGKYFPRGTNILLATVIGNNWERVQFLSKEEVKAELFQVLKNMYGDAAVEPEDILIPDWHTNPLFFGAYSNWPIGVSSETYQNLDAPVGRLNFAGEACSAEFSGYLHGAMESGELTANNLYKCMVHNDCEKVPENGYGYNKGCRRR